jgi:multiple sugar transport system permease protein
VLQTFWMSLHDFVLFRPNNAPFVGLGNFVRAFTDPVFWTAAWNSVLWIVFVVGFQFLLGLGTALLLNQSFWWRGLARALVIIPWALPSVITALMWSWMYDYDLGVINDVLLRLHVIDAPIAWLARADTTLGAVILALVWQGFPFFAVMILAGLQTVPAELLEAAEIDGANAFQRFWHVTMPGLRPTHVFVLVITTIQAFKLYTQVAILTQGGPKSSTETVVHYMVRAGFEEQKLGADEGGNGIVDFAVQKDDPLAQEAGIDIEGSFPSGGLFDDHRDELHRFAHRRTPIVWDCDGNACRVRRRA